MNRFTDACRMLRKFFLCVFFMFAAILCESGVFGLNATETQGEREQAVVRGPGQSFSVGSLAPV